MPRVGACAAPGVDITVLKIACDCDNDVATVVYDFGDGTQSTMHEPDHTYAQPGTYSVTLTVTDKTGLVSVYSDSVYVSGMDST